LQKEWRRPRHNPQVPWWQLEKLAGTMLAEMEKAKGQLYRGSIMEPPKNAPKLADLGIDKKESHRWQQEAEV
jgi:hypothetical protein